ncbi:protein YdhT [Proteus sp. G2671]|uniref:protein YdhT n=1 Tax=Proteus sp. G2671 TaxID=2698883 RepID=UPI001376F52F|nr:protein YdhT [Proteus sp. G2671]NBM03320.1 subunit of oxidoreductase [Proteus sp. G2671]
MSVPSKENIRLTKKDLRQLHVSTSLYRWFLRYFPDGGTYSAIHSELIKQRRTQWIESLIQYIYLRHFSETSFAKQEQEVMENILFLLDDEQQQGVTLQRLPYHNTLPTSENIQFSTEWHQLILKSQQLSTDLALCGNNNIVAFSGDENSIANTGYSNQLMITGFAGKIANSGNQCRIGSLGGRSRISNSGNDVKIYASGNGVHIANSGIRNFITASQDRAKITNTGDLAQINVTGKNAVAISTGDNCKITVSGDDSICISTGNLHQFCLGKGGSAVIAYHDGNRTRFKIFYEGEDGIEADVRYTLDENQQPMAEKLYSTNKN